LLYVLPGENVQLFADDTNLFIFDVDVNMLNWTCNYSIETLNQWFIANYLHMNVDKTNVMVFSETKTNDVCAKFNVIAITKVQYCRYLVY